MIYTTAQLILGAAWRAAAGLYLTERRPNFCLKFVRQVVENGLNKPDGWFYSLTGSAAHTAAGAEHALQKFAVPFAERQAGDIVFNGHVSLPDGHVGLLVSRDVVLENTSAARGVRLGGALAITPLTVFGPVTSVVRLPENL